MSQPKIWLITGTSTGIGRLTTEYVLEQGHIVIALTRNPRALSDLSSKYDSSKLLVLKVDIFKIEEIQQTFVTIKEKFGRLDVVYNNAGGGPNGAIESTSDDLARWVFELNFWPVVNISKEAVRFFREVNKPGIGGKVINASSMAGVKAIPSIGFYSAAKFAVEGFSESLAKELNPAWNIHILTLTLGGFKSNGIKAMEFLPVPPAYEGGIITQMQQWLSGPDNRAETTDAVKAIYKLANDAPKRQRFPLGADAIAAVREKAGILVEDCNEVEEYTKEIP